MQTRKRALLALALASLAGCTSTGTDPIAPQTAPPPAAAATIGAPASTAAGKPVIYQVFTRLYGNQQTRNRPWGTLAENGVGKFADFSDSALASIRELGVSHIWYTGVLHHASVTDYSAYGIPGDDPDVVKGRAGSPYAIRDYYNVDPDLATDPAQRLDEFRALIARSHAHGLRVIIDIVPNHVARGYQSSYRGAPSLGANDDRSVEYARDNQFYYLPGQDFQVPVWPADYRPLGGEAHPLIDGQYQESPAKWTGNGSRAAQPKFDDWYETVKLNFGVRPDGSYDFDRLPADYAQRDTAAHYAFWEGRDVPATWLRFREIAAFWLDQGVDGFRYDMAEMVPVEFWSYLNASIKQRRPDATLIAEVYNPKEYRNYLQLGRMDYLYDKVDFYDSLKLVMQGKGSTDALAEIQDRYADIESHLLHFLENHDEQRIASPDFAGDARKGLPAMLVSATISRSPTMLYFGQDVGEPGAGDAGFGRATRTTIFDYWGVPAHQRYMSAGRFDGSASTAEERALRDYYKALLNYSATQPAMRGAYAEIHRHNRAQTPGYDDRLYAYARWTPTQQVLVVANFDEARGRSVDLEIPLEVSANWHLESGQYTLVEQLGSGLRVPLVVHPGGALVTLNLPPLAAYLFELER